ncbi:MAG: IS5 family transposase [bacterium]|nr:IS5 family transposase [bacterium]
MKTLNFFAEDNRLAKLSKLGDQLEKLNRVMDWKIFEPLLKGVFTKETKGAGGRPPYDYVMMFKILILQRIYNIGDDQTEFQINDRMSFMRFLGLALGETVPDAKTIWNFRDTLAKAGVMESLFALFARELEVRSIVTHKGTIVDATFVEAPKQRNTREENKRMKNGEVPENWSENKRRQKDTDARWTKKNNEAHFGYKNHVKVDADSKIITKYAVTSANVHDSQEFTNFLDDTDMTVYADSAYAGQQVPAQVRVQICEKGYRNHPLTEEQKKTNREKSKIRCRIEHVFGYMTGSMRGITFRGVGKTRVDFNIVLTNLVYNMCRYATLLQPKPARG